MATRTVAKATKATKATGAAKPSRAAKVTRPAKVTKPKRAATKPASATSVRKVGAAARARSSVASASAPALSPEQIGQILELLKGANSLELKLSVPLASQRATIKAIGLDPVEAQPRQAFFFDTPDLALNRAGLVVRVRRSQGGTGDTVIKLRPVDPNTIDTELRRSASFKTEVDVMPGGFVCSASFKGICTGKEALDATSGNAPLSSLFSKEQLAFYEAHAPAGISLDSLTVLGPTFVLKAKHQPKDFDRRITVEMWLYPDGQRILEVSTKALPSEAFQVGATFKAYLARLGVSLAAKQETKTKTAMEFFKAKIQSDVGGMVPATVR